MSKSLIAAQLLGETLSAQDVASSFKSLNESIAKTSDEPLAQTYKQYVLKGNSYEPVGDATLMDSLKSCAYEIKMTMTGPIFTRVKPQTDSLMVFENSAMSKVVEEIDRFWNRKDKYNALGLMHSRGIIMHGPPGTGKSACLQQVVEMMVNRGNVVFFANDATAIREGLRAFRQVEPDRRVVICFEEADELLSYGGERTMAQLMDGDTKVDNVLYLATTNHLDRLSARMLRPGRFDKKVYVAPPNLESRRRFLEKKLRDITDSDMISTLARRSDGMSFGHLRELIAGVFAIGDPVEEVLTRLREGRPVHDQDGQKVLGESLNEAYGKGKGGLPDKGLSSKGPAKKDKGERHELGMPDDATKVKHTFKGKSGSEKADDDGDNWFQRKMKSKQADADESVSSTVAGLLGERQNRAIKVAPVGKRVKRTFVQKKSVPESAQVNTLVDGLLNDEPNE
jgi:hypothetical protein